MNDWNDTMPHIPGGFGHVAHEISLSGDLQPMFVTYGVELNSLTVATANSLHDVFADSFGPVIGSDYTIQNVSIFTPTVIQESTDAPRPCSDNVQSLPPNTAALITKDSGFRGRKNTGRMFLPGVSEGNVTPTGALISAQHTAYQNAANSFFSALVALADIESMVILHTLESDGAPTPVVALTVSNVVATQRRRLR